MSGDVTLEVVMVVERRVAIFPKAVVGMTGHVTSEVVVVVERRSTSVPVPTTLSNDRILGSAVGNKNCFVSKSLKKDLEICNKFSNF